MDARHNARRNSPPQFGFTLLELMIALALGLLISAAAIQLFLTSQKHVNLQQGLMNLQSDSIFGLESMVRDIRLANLNAYDVVANDTVLHGGIVLNAKNYSHKYKTNSTGNSTNEIDIKLIDALSTSGQGLSNLQGVGSDVLVTQYKNILPNQYDCEGRQLPQSVYVVQRYFLTVDTDTNDPNKALALACHAVSYTGDTVTAVDLSGQGQIIIPRVDHFAVLLLIAQDGRNASCNANLTSAEDGVMDCFGYISIEDYKKLSANSKPQIIAVKIGVLIRSLNTVGKDKFYDKSKIYNVLNVSAPLIENSRNDLYIRQLVTQTIALRNGFGIAK